MARVIHYKVFNLDTACVIEGCREPSSLFDSENTQKIQALERRLQERGYEVASSVSFCHSLPQNILLRKKTFITRDEKPNNIIVSDFNESNVDSLPYFQGPYFTKPKNI